MKQVGEYQITHPNIAKGAFASIHKGKHIYSDYIVAIKEIKLNGEPIKNYIKREIEIHRALDHPNIVRVLDVIYESNTSLPQPLSHNTSVYIIMEYCQYGDLQKFQNKKPFSHKHIQNYMLQLRDALQYLRTRNIVHRDLKPQNILLTSPIHIKITDFGLARYINIETELHTPPEHEDLFSTYCGSPIYMSPELLNHQQYNSKSDLWSLGVILYELITGTPPFIAKNIKNLVYRVNTEKINLDKIDRTLISDDCFNLLCNLLNHDKLRRVDWDEFFTHKWFSNNIILEEENRLIENPLCYNLIDFNTTTPHTTTQHTTIPHTTTAHTTTAHTTTAETEIIKLISSSSSGLKFSDHLNINTNSPKPEHRHTSIDKSFTFSLKSSRLSEESKQTNQQQKQIECANQINLSDLVQDDIPGIIATSPHNNMPNIFASKPITIVGRNNRYLRTPPSSESGSSTSIQSSNINTSGNSAPTRGIINALRFIKETYDYLSSDNKSL
jgi:serine/threonine-protein kinase ULK/ATG1